MVERKREVGGGGELTYYFTNWNKIGCAWFVFVCLVFGLFNIRCQYV